MKNKTWLVCILLLAAINIIFFWPGKLYFLNDDLLHIPLTDQGYLFQTNSVRPIHELLVRVDLFLWGKSAVGYHITALILHFFVCIQLYNLCQVMQMRWLKIDRGQATQASLLAVILFLAYPQSSESLAWILGRTPVLSAIFLLTTIRLFFVENYKWTIYVSSAFMFAATLFTYEQSLLLPIALTGIALYQKQKAKRQEMLMYIFILFVVDIGYVIVRKLITSEVVGAYEGNNLLASNWLALAANAFRFFFKLILNPAEKNVFICSSILLLLITSVILLRIRNIGINKKAFVFFAAMISLLIAPVISLGLAITSFESGRYLYLPSIFFIAGISIASVYACYQSANFKAPLIGFLILITAYWLWGKKTAARNYSDASFYAKSVHTQVLGNFKNSVDTIYINSLHVTVHQLPVFRVGFKTGLKWLNNNLDTNKIVVKGFID